LFDDTQKIRACTIHFVDERKSRYVVLIRLTPYRFRLRLDAANGAKNADRAIEYTQGTLYFNREINVAGRIDDIDSVHGELLAHAAPETCRSRRGNRYAAFLFLFHPVHGGRAIVDFTYFVRDAGVIQDPLGRGRFTRIDMGHDANIAIAFDGCNACHVPNSKTQRYQR
jgi:hypothetical protein